MPDDRTDEALLLAFRGGQQRAFAVIVERWAPRLRAYARRLVGSPQVGEEFVMEAFVRLAQHAPRWEPGGRVRGWLFTVVRRLCLDELRANARHDDDQDVIIDLEAHRGRGTPEDAAELGELGRDLEVALSRLSASHRDVLLLRVVHGLDSDECARVMGLAEDQVRSQLSYARKQLRQGLRAHGVAGRKESSA